MTDTILKVLIELHALICKREGAEAENAHRAACGYSPAYTDDRFADLAARIRKLKDQLNETKTKSEPIPLDGVGLPNAVEDNGLSAACRSDSDERHQSTVHTAVRKESHYREDCRAAPSSPTPARCPVM